MHTLYVTAMYMHAQPVTVTLNRCSVPTLDHTRTAIISGLGYCRVFLFISFALNVNNNPTINLTLIIATCSILMIAIQPGIYRNMLLESSLYVNLIVFSTVPMVLMADTDIAHKTELLLCMCLWDWLCSLFLV